MSRVVSRFLLASAALSAPAACSDGDANGAPPSIEVISFNILHGLRAEDPSGAPYDRFPDRLPRIAAEIGERRPAAALLQEAVFSDSPGYPDLLRTFVPALGSPVTLIFGDVFGTEPVRFGGNGFGQLTITTVPAGEAANHLVVNVEAFTVRTVLHVRADSPIGTIDLFNAHLQGPADPALSDREMNDVIAFVRSRTATGAIAILGGDLNREDTDPSLRLLTEAGFVDLAAASGLRCTGADRSGCTNETFPLDQPGFRASRRIDYLWMRSGGAAIDARAEPIFHEPAALDGGGVLWLSDHIGLTATLTLRP